LRFKPPDFNLFAARWEEENLMAETKPTETLSSQTAPPKLEQVQQTQEAQAKAGPQPVQPHQAGKEATLSQVSGAGRNATSCGSVCWASATPESDIVE
jgi:hypothetical protein